jgi:hypothetical protein
LENANFNHDFFCYNTAMKIMTLSTGFALSAPKRQEHPAGLTSSSDTSVDEAKIGDGYEQST